MPAFMTVTQHESCGGDWHPNRSIVDQFPAGLQTSPQEGIRRASDAQSSELCHLYYSESIFTCQGQRFFVVNRFSGGKGCHGYPSMSSRRGQVYHDLNLRI
jgi:hypothetical protein